MTKTRLPDPPDHERDQPDAISNVHAEKAIMGAILLENSLYRATGGLEADDFYLNSHKTLYLRIAEMIESGEAVDIVTLVESLIASKDLASICNSPIAYISDLNRDTIRYAPSVKEWARIIKGKSLLRRLIAACSGAIDKAYAGEPGRDIIAALKYQLEEIESTAKRGMGA